MAEVSAVSFLAFSRKTMPKRFWILGTGRSLLQQDFRPDSTKLFPTENILIVTNAIYADLVKEQLPELDPKQILLEPARRNTAPCICMGIISYTCFKSKCQHRSCPSDHLILKRGRILAAIERTGLCIKI